MAAGDCPRDTKTTIVAPTSPASANSCQDGRLVATRLGAVVEVSELIFQARVELAIDRRRGRRRDLAPRPAPRGGDDAEERQDRDHVRQQPRHAVEPAVGRLHQHVVAAMLAHEGGEDGVVVLALGDVLLNLARLARLAVAVHHAAVAHRQPAAAAVAHDLAGDLALERAAQDRGDRLLCQRHALRQGHREEDQRDAWRRWPEPARWRTRRPRRAGARCRCRAPAARIPSTPSSRAG